MFSGFKRAIPQISIFHNPSSPPSQAALKLLTAASTSPYPAGSSKPLSFNLEVIEKTPPTPDQLRTILSYLPSSSSASSFISSHPSSSGSLQSDSTEAVVKLAASNPNALKWPIVVDWVGGKAAVGDVEGVKGILEELRKKRDGEVKGEETDKPKGWFS